ncbi:type II toxin-antitoxin system antitoxin SocA domain-containing protein [Arthrobacter sp. UYCo732]|uniref:Panacea domain-containing protein n=1 Tax=Arthrobacter sp. UYCo732 TaxID=3156336 RepID=UPI0033983B6C
MTTTVTVHDSVAFLLGRARGHLSVAAIHRMTYYAQGWHLAWAGTALFHEEIRIRNSGPVAHALFPFQKDGATETEWPAGNAAAITGHSAEVLKYVFNSYGHMTGISMGELARKEAPCILALARKTSEDTEPVIDLAEMKSFFKALDDAPEDQTAYANRFMAQYTDETLRVWP